MYNFHTIREPQWENTEHDWRAVAAPYSKGYQWTAYIEPANAPFWRVWAGCLFDNIEDAQLWCRDEIHRQVHRTHTGRPAAAVEVDEETGRGYWLWGKLEPMHNNDFMSS